MPGYVAEHQEREGRREVRFALGFLFIAGVLAILPLQPQQWIAAVFRSTVLAPFLMGHESLVRAQVQGVEAQVFQARLDSLSQVLLGSATLAEENRQLRSLLGLSSRMGAQFRSASIIRAGTQGSESIFMLDAGLADGVRVNAPVVVAGGLVGVVREVGERSSIGMDWTHPDFRASAMSEDGIYYGFVQPEHGAFREEDRMLLNGLPYSSALAPGVRISTSGWGGIFPRGIPVGIVEELAEAEAGWRTSYWLRPAVVPGSVTHVLVAVEGGGAALGETPPGWWAPPESGSNPFDSVAVPPVLAPLDSRGLADTLGGR